MGCRGLWPPRLRGEGRGEIQRSNKNRRIKFTFEEKTFRTIVSFPAPLPAEEEEEEEALRATPTQPRNRILGKYVRLNREAEEQTDPETIRK